MILYLFLHLLALEPHAMLHAGTHQHQANGRSPHTALAPIPEVPECSSKAASSPSPSERLDFDLGDATGESTADERAEHATEHVTERAAKRAAVKRKLPVWRSVTEWPASREAFGRITLKGSADPQAKGTRAVCRILDGVLTLGIEQRSAAGERTEEVVAEVPTEVLAVGLRRGRANMLTLATVHKNKLFDEIYCFCDDSTSRNKWIAVFRRMGVLVFDLRD
jgi:hypothetical protein